MAEHTINCEDCGQEVAARNSITKYCKICRLGRNLAYLASRSTRCWGCEVMFAPLSRNDRLCASCDAPASQGPRGRCDVCQRNDVILGYEELPICSHCLRGKKERRLVFQIVQRVRAERGWRKEPVIRVAQVTSDTSPSET